MTDEVVTWSTMEDFADVSVNIRSLYLPFGLN